MLLVSEDSGYVFVEELYGMSNKDSFKGILVPTDGSASSLMAEETAAKIAKKTGATVIVMHVAPEINPASYQLPRNIEEEILGSAEQKAEKTTGEALALFAEEGVKADRKIEMWRDPAETIIEASCEYALTVLGASGENEKDPLVLGSVARRVLAHAACPTLIVKKVSELSNFLVCVDGSKSALKAVDYGVRLAEMMGAKVTLLNVAENRIFGSKSRVAEELSEKIFADAISTIGDRNVKVEKKLVLGAPSNVIVDIAEKGNYDVIVLGKRGHGRVKRFLLGSVSDGVSYKAKCSVLLVPTRV